MTKTWSTLDNLNIDQKVLKGGFNQKIRNSRVRKSSYEIELRKVTSHFKLLTQFFYRKSSLELKTGLRKTSNFPLSYSLES